MKDIFDLPKDKNYPPDAVQCHDCGGLGTCADGMDCKTCNAKGWLPKGHPRGRRCERWQCKNFIPPAQVAIYCSNECAIEDA